jgi:hypothetical protein
MSKWVVVRGGRFLCREVGGAWAWTTNRLHAVTWGSMYAAAMVAAEVGGVAVPEDGYV